MKILKTKHPHKATRIKRRFAWWPVTVTKETGMEWTVWWEHYQTEDVYYSHGESMTGYDYTPRGWHIMNRRPDGFYPENVGVLAHADENPSNQ